MLRTTHIRGSVIFLFGELLCQFVVRENYMQCVAFELWGGEG